MAKSIKAYWKTSDIHQIHPSSPPWEATEVNTAIRRL